MSPSFVIYNFLTNIFYLSKNSFEKNTKAKIFIYYLRFTFVFPFYKFFKLKNLKFQDFQIEGFTYDNIYHLFGEIFVKGSYYFQAKVKNPTIVDAGANIGISVLFFKFLYPKSTIFAFEPDPQTFHMLTKNVQKNNLKKIHLYNLALTDKTKTIDFYTDLSGSESASAFAQNNLKEKIKVKSITLSSFIKETGYVDLLKVDIEGAEYLVFKDLIAKNCLRSIQEIIVEYHHNLARPNRTLDEFLGLLRRSGFKYQVDGISMPLYRKNFYEAILIYAYK